MPAQHANELPARPEGFFDVVTNRQSYLNLLYLLISFPLGTFYFIFIVTGISLGMGLAVVLVGFFILLVVLAAVRAFSSWELRLSAGLLGARPAPGPAGPVDWGRPWQALKKTLGDAGTWKGLLFLLLKFPVGILSFVLVVTFGSLTLSLLLTPLALWFVPVTIVFWHVTSAEGALLCFALGMLFGVVSLHILNALGSVWRALSVALLADGQAAPAPASVPAGSPVIIP